MKLTALFYIWRAFVTRRRRLSMAWPALGMALMMPGPSAAGQVAESPAVPEPPPAAPAEAVPFGEVENRPETVSDRPPGRLEPQLPPAESEAPPRQPDDFRKPWWEWERATGDWFNLRPALEEHGLAVEAFYFADFFSNLRGGLNTSDAHVYHGLFDLGLTLDTATAGLWDGGILFVHFQNTHGRNISEEYIGDLQVINNADAPTRTQVAEFFYEQRFWDDRLRIKLGKMDANNDFAFVTYGLEFVHSSPGFPPVIPLPSYPDPALAAVVRVEPVEWLYLAAGVYDTEWAGNRWGFDTAFHGPADSVTLVELGLRPVLPVGEHGLPGTYKVGTWYHSGQRLVLPTRPPRDDDPRPDRFHRGHNGIYVMADQMLYREPTDTPPSSAPGEPAQGLGAFVQFAWAPSAYSELSQYYGAGVQYLGLIPGRDQDVTGIGLFHVSLSGRIQSVEERYSETAIEFFHRFQLTPSLSLKPDLQYIANPGGAGRDAFAAGVRMEISF